MTFSPMQGTHNASLLTTSTHKVLIICNLQQPVDKELRQRELTERKA